MVYTLATEGQEKIGAAKRFKGYNVMAVDGTTISLPDTTTTWREFGTISNKHTQRCIPRCSLLFDVMNNTFYNAEIGTSTTGEASQIYDQIKYIPQNTILVLDRLYPSICLMRVLEKAGIKYLMRSKQNWTNQMRAFVADKNSRDKVVTHRITESAVTSLKRMAKSSEEKKAITCREEITYRMLKTKLSDNQREYLVTNLIDEDWEMKDFHRLYGLRWRIETAIDKLKGALAIENFSGHKPERIRQDFHARICLYNIISFAQTLAQRDLDAKNEAAESCEIAPKKKAKHKKKINFNLTSSVIFRIISMENHQENSSFEYCKDVWDLLLRFPEPVREGRSFPRKRKRYHARGKHRCYTNYTHTA